MMKNPFLTLFRQDLLLSWRNGLVTVTLVTLAVIVGLYWILPVLVSDESSLKTESQVFVDRTAGKVITAYLESRGASDSLFETNEEKLRLRLEKDVNLVGIIADGSRESISFTLILPQAVGVQSQNIMEAVLRDMAHSLHDERKPVNIQYLRPLASPKSMNKTLVAVLLTFEVMILGFLFIAVVVFSEKQEGSIRAYRVSPAGLYTYIASKTLVFVLMSVSYGLLLVLLTVGVRVDIPALLLVLALSCTLMTMLGLGVAVFFTNISEWFVSGVLILCINMLSILPFQIPAFSAPAVKLLPGYSVIFAMSEIIMPTGKTGYVTPVIATLGIQLVIVTVFTVIAVNHRMMKEGK